MKAPKIISGLFALISLSAVNGYGQEFTLTTTSANTVSSKTTIDLPGLAGNPLAIIVATPVGDTAKLNPHPIGAWYYNGKWNIFNTDHAVMPLGLKYKVQVFSKPGANQILHVVTKYTVSDEGSWVDEPTLNNNPNAQVKILQNHAPDNRPYFLNKFETTIFYNASSGKWFIKNANDSPLAINTTYNVVVTSGGSASANTVPSTSSPAATVTAPAASSAGEVNSTALMSPAPLRQDPQTVPLSFDNLNDFPEKGLPAPAALPFGNVDHAAAIMAQQILRSDEHSLPVLLTALQAAGFTVIDKNGKVLLRPADGKGQGLNFFDFEAVGSLKIDKSFVKLPLEKIAATITKQVPEIPARQFGELMLQDLRAAAESADNPYLRFWARLIIQLGNVPGNDIDLMDAPTSRVTLNVLQTTLMLRRLQGVLYRLKKTNGIVTRPGGIRSNFMPAFFRTDQGIFQLAAPATKPNPCNLTGDQALILDGAAIYLTTWNGSVVAGFDSPAMTKLGAGVQGANAALAWHKLVASVTMMRGEIHLQKDPLIRTINSDTSKLSNRRLMVARLWSEVGDVEALNCLRPTLNLLTGLDFNLPTGGPLGDVAIEWHFAGDNETRVNDASTRNTASFVGFESDKGKDPNPQKQVTDDKGLSKMWLVGKAKVPAIIYANNPIKVEKKAEVYVAVTLKSAKDLKQNVIDFSGFVLGVAQAIKGGDTIGFTGVLIGAGAEIGYRLPYVAARATVPVIDHEECEGGWTGTVTYTVINTSKTKKIIEPYKSGFQESGGGYESLDHTITQSGTVTVNGGTGKGSITNGSADEIMIMDHYTSGKVLCSRIQGPRSYSVRSTETRYGSGTSQGLLNVSISLDKDTYQISLKPLNVAGIVTSTATGSAPGNCAGKKPTSYTNTTKNTWGLNDYIVGKGSYGDEPGVLSGSSTRNPVPSVTVTVTWNLKRCQ